MEFNNHSRTQNVLKASSVSAVTSIISLILSFVYRTIFIKCLSSTYLGLNGLFSNVLDLLSLADLGISTAIIFRFYEPISKNDVETVGRLMNYYKNIYRLIAFVITILGLSLTPFIKFFIKESAEIPVDINIYVVYLLFLAQTVVSYTYVYKQSLLSADQNNHTVSFLQFIVNFTKCIVQIVILIVYKNYTLTLLIGIIFTVLMNYSISVWITAKYKEVFDVKNQLTREEKKQILHDTKACMMHKIGGKVLVATDSIVLSKCVSLFAAGIYSNYTLITNGLNRVVNPLLSNFISSIGNASVELNVEDNYLNYRRLLFVDYWISSVITVCFVTLANDFMSIWLGSSMALSNTFVLLLGAQFYLENIRLINMSYTSATGLFVKDKYRPIIEAILNLGISIILSTQYGISGVVLGTIVSHILTVNWREPYILFKHYFHKSIKEYWSDFFLFPGIMICTIVLIEIIVKQFDFVINSVTAWIVKAAIIFAFANFVMWFLLKKRKEYSFLLNKIHNIFNSALNR